MNFDVTHIVIRERGFAEIMDLALKVVRAHLPSLLFCGLLGAAPWAIVNGLLLNGLVDVLDLEENAFFFVYYMLLLVTVQTPLATAPITLYLGQVTFLEKTDSQRIFSDFVRSLPQMLVHTVVRGLLALTFFGLMLPYGFRPYISELILLERNPLFAGQDKRMTTARRSRNLHNSAGGDLFGNWMASLAVGALLLASLMLGIYLACQQLAGHTPSPLEVLIYCLPVSAWLVVEFFAIVRFLSYLDLRIRREGWEVELKMRSEAARLAKGIM